MAAFLFLGLVPCFSGTHLLSAFSERTVYEVRRHDHSKAFEEMIFNRRFEGEDSQSLLEESRARRESSRLNTSSRQNWAVRRGSGE